jgi:hypothetical protein
MVAYVPSGKSWIAIGTPLADPDRRAGAVRRFCAAARAHGRRPVFFGIEDRVPFSGCRTLTLGLQSVLKPSEWDATLRRRPKLREQLRRARAKGVTVRAVDPAELDQGTPLHTAVARLRAEWLASRAMEPLGFLVDVEPFYARGEHRYFVAERGPKAVQFLSCVPIYASSGWLMEDMLRGTDAPNGTTELLIAAMMQSLDGDPCWLTPGLTPLTGTIPWWLRVVRFSSVALYDFSGLLRFRSRLRPAAWMPVSLAWDRGSPFGVLLDVLRAFANGRLVRFALRSLVWHPNGPPWVVAVPLVAWTALLAALVISGNAWLLGYSSVSLSAWVVFDLAIARLLFTVAHKPQAGRLTMMAIVVMCDAAVSLRHVADIGLGVGMATVLTRTVATVGPLIGTVALFWAAWRARVARIAAAVTPRLGHPPDGTRRSPHPRRGCHADPAAGSPG